jgi:hypothetical protein
LRLWRYAGKNENAWMLYARDDDGTNLQASDCTVDPTAFICALGGPGTLYDASVATSSLRVGFACSNTSTTCAPGATLHEVWTGIYSALVTVDDPVPPTASGATGTILDSGYVRGTVTAGVTGATDSTGIRALQVRVDGDRVVGTSPDRATCDFSRRSPCEPVTGNEEFSFDSRNIGDGTYTAQVGAIDAGRNFAAAGSRQITVDNTAPSAPTPTSLTTAATSAVVAWDDPPGQTAPITRAHVTVCGPTACSTTTQPDTRTATIGLGQGFGAYTASVALEDAAGNFAPGNATTWTITLGSASGLPPITAPQPGPAPVPTPTPTPVRKTSARLTASRLTVARDRRTIVARGSVAPGATGRVAVTAAARINGRTRTMTRHATIRRRRYAIRLRLPSSAWHIATVTVRFAGDAAHDPARVVRRVSQRRR